MANFTIGSGEGSTTITIDRTVGSDQRTDLGRTLSYAWRHNLSIDVSYGASAATMTLGAEQLRILAGTGSLERRIALVSGWLHDSGVDAAFPNPDAPNGLRENAIRVLDAIEEWNPQDAATQATSYIVLDGSSNGDSGVLAALPESLVGTVGEDGARVAAPAIPDGFDYGRSSRADGTIAHRAAPVLAAPVARPNVPQTSTAPSAMQSIFSALQDAAAGFELTGVILNGREVPVTELANAATPAAAWAILHETFPRLSRAQLLNAARAVIAADAPASGCIRLTTVAGSPAVVPTGT